MRHSAILNGKASVSSKGQIVIPKAFREKLGINAGNELLFEMRDDDVIEIRPLKRSIEMLFGCCRGDDDEFVDVDAAIEQAITEKHKLNINPQKRKKKKEKK